MIKKIKAKISDILQLTDNTKHFVLDLEDNFKFSEGQFVICDFEINGEKIKRAYSIACLYDENNSKQIELCVQKLDDGKVSKFLFEIEKGFEFEIMGPLGHFLIDNSKENEIYFIATGTGISPFRAGINYLLKKNIDKKIHLFFGCKTKKDILYYDEFKKLEEENENFKYVVCLSKEENVDFEFGRVQKNLEIKKNCDYYICGKKEMVEDVFQTLLDKSILKENIFMEKYG